MSRRVVRFAGLLAGLVMLAVVGVWFFSNDADRVVHAGAPIAAKLERYREAHGRYPATLQDAGASAPEVGGRQLVYRPHADGAEYELLAGDYERDGFVAGYRNGQAFVDH
jgi:hypothetical protein